MIQIKIKGLPQQPQQIREKSLPEISKQIIKTMNASSNSDVKAITVIKNVFNGINNDIAVNLMYVDSNGDMVKISKFADGRSLIEIEPCEETIKYDELLCETIETNDEKISTGITRQRIKLEGNEIDICQMTLGTYRNYIEDVAVFDNLNVKQKRIPIPKLDNNGNIIPKSFTYESRIMCPPANKEQVIKLIKELKKTIIEWF